MFILNLIETPDRLPPAVYPTHSTYWVKMICYPETKLTPNSFILESDNNIRNLIQLLRNNRSSLSSKLEIKS